jgi:hypothetical protein
MAPKGSLIPNTDFKRCRQAYFDGVTSRPVFAGFGVGMTPSLYPDLQNGSLWFPQVPDVALLQVGHTQWSADAAIKISTPEYHPVVPAEAARY